MNPLIIEKAQPRSHQQKQYREEVAQSQKKQTEEGCRDGKRDERMHQNQIRVLRFLVMGEMASLLQLSHDGAEVAPVEHESVQGILEKTPVTASRR